MNGKKVESLFNIEVQVLSVTESTAKELSLGMSKPEKCLLGAGRVAKRMW